LNSQYGSFGSKGWWSPMPAIVPPDADESTRDSAPTDASLWV
jgi:hypothetical protein